MRVSAQARRQQILNTAGGLFSAKGFEGTTTREIAESAGINEAIIFRHFPSKDGLYWAVVEEQISKRCSGKGGRKYSRSLQSVQRALSKVACSLLERNEEDVALTRLLLFSALRNRDLAEQFFRKYMAETLARVSDCIQQGVRQGYLREVDPEVAARAFVGMVVYHNLVQELFGGSQQEKADPQKLGEQLADIWLNGISAKQRDEAEHEEQSAHSSSEGAGGEQAARNGKGSSAEAAGMAAAGNRIPTLSA